MLNAILLWIGQMRTFLLRKLSSTFLNSFCVIILTSTILVFRLLQYEQCNK